MFNCRYSFSWYFDCTHTPPLPSALSSQYFDCTSHPHPSPVICHALCIFIVPHTPTPPHLLSWNCFEEAASSNIMCPLLLPSPILCSPYLHKINTADFAAGEGWGGRDPASSQSSSADSGRGLLGRSGIMAAVERLCK